MINIICALKCEADPILKRLGAVKGKKPVTGYFTDNIRMFVAGPGRENVVNLFRRLEEAFDLQGDVFINIGVCGCRDEAVSKGTPYLINSIKSDCSRKPFYPDMLIKSGLMEAGIMSMDSPSADISIKPLLADMESHTFFSEALKRTFSSNIHVIKIVSDHMDPSSVTSSGISGYVNSNLEMITCYIRDAGALAYRTPSPPPGFADYFELFRFSESMKSDMLSLLRFYTLKNGNPPTPVIFKGFQPPENKKQSLEIYNEIRKRLI